MTTFSAADIADMLGRNPDLTLDDPGSLIAGPGELARRAVQSEAQMQTAVFAEADRRALTDARWRLLFAIPNGGHRNKATAGRMKAEGVRAGVPDIFLPVPNASKGFHGVFIELKVKHNKPTVKQLTWLADLAAQGYFCAIVYDNPAEVIELLAWYLEE